MLNTFKSGDLSHIVFRGKQQDEARKSTPLVQNKSQRIRRIRRKNAEMNFKQSDNEVDTFISEKKYWTFLRHSDLSTILLRISDSKLPIVPYYALLSLQPRSRILFCWHKKFWRTLLIAFWWQKVPRDLQLSKIFP